MKKIEHFAKKLVPSEIARRGQQQQRLCEAIREATGHAPLAAWIKDRTLYIKINSRKTQTELHYAQRRTLASTAIRDLGVDTQKTILEETIKPKPTISIRRTAPPKKVLELAAENIDHQRLAKALRDLISIKPPQ